MLSLFRALRWRCTLRLAAVLLLVFSLPPVFAQATVSIDGTVTDPQGGLIPGATVTVHAGTVEQQATTGPEGAYHLEALPAGAATLTASAKNFAPASRDLTLVAGQALALEPIVLIVRVAEVVNVELPLYDQAEEDMHVEEQQRVVGVLPNFLVSYRWQAVPLTAGQKYRLMARNLFDPGNLLLIGTVAGAQQGLNSFPGYHQGAKGYGKRFGADGADLVVGSVVGSAVLPSIFHQDPRYFYRGSGSVAARVWYAATRAVITRSDSGRSEFNYSGVLGNFSAGAVSNLYYPRHERGVGLTFENGGLGIAGDVLNGLVQEFVLNRLTTHRPKGGGKP